MRRDLCPHGAWFRTSEEVHFDSREKRPRLEFAETVVVRKEFIRRWGFEIPHTRLDHEPIGDSRSAAHQKAKRKVIMERKDG